MGDERGDWEGPGAMGSGMTEVWCTEMAELYDTNQLKPPAQLILRDGTWVNTDIHHKENKQNGLTDLL